MYTRASSPRELCEGVKSVCEGEFKTLCARPWNQYAADTSRWWLVPATDWPAYRFGKLYFDWDDEGDPSVPSCGLHVERGLDRSLAAVYPSGKGQRYIMQPDWEWDSFLRDWEAGRLTAAVEALRDGFGDELSIGVENSYVPDPTQFDPLSILRRADEQDRYGSLEGAKRKVDSLKSEPWRWIDVWIGVRLRVQSGDSSGDAITPARLWADGLRHFLPWLT